MRLAKIEIKHALSRTATIGIVVVIIIIIAAAGYFALTAASPSNLVLANPSKYSYVTNPP